jgi:hypothetical protein
MFIVIDLILSYNKKNYRNLISTENLYESLVFLVENVLFYTMEANKTILGEFLMEDPLAKNIREAAASLTLADDASF